jgi:1,2-phenylacetyl-CoA epoxidase PaaB subunit
MNSIETNTETAAVLRLYFIVQRRRRRWVKIGQMLATSRQQAIAIARRQYSRRGLKAISI